MKGITGLGHVALKVRSIEGSLAFYRDTLGFAEMMRLQRDDGSLMLIYLRITDDQYLELFPGDDPSPAPGPDATAINHFCLTVADLDQVVGELTARGVALHRPIKMGLDRNRQAWLEDPDGNRVELMEMAPDCLQYEGLARLRAAAGPGR
jgi:lactoylglutathione lyase